MKLVWVNKRIGYVRSNNYTKIEWDIAYTSKGDLSDKKQYSSNIGTLSNYRDDNLFIHPPAERGGV